jgi:hypothetical protein
MGAVCAALVLFVHPGDPLRPIAGLLLAGPLAAWSIDRFVVARAQARPAVETRWALAVGFALTADLAVGLVLAVTSLKLEPAPMAIGLLLVIGACELTSRATSTGTSLISALRSPAWGLACLAVGLGVAAFVIARDGAVNQARHQATASAYLLRDGSGYQAVLDNPTAGAQRFSITVTREGARPARLTAVVGARGSQRLALPITARQGLYPAFALRATVTGGRQRGLILRLTAPALG